ncbi:hypothetical protein FXN65_24115 [Metapseudomonas lalkuanensis]|uniref:Uncharacterized protein n=1 Tax=Metapseudomonas lalkuanensis TaxID=2604832 RepID=A0A5J6QR87_9GAMM|nr:hypothetical protein FXN65_24115 [Pseudomonas lalkuanensis]
MPIPPMPYTLCCPRCFWKKTIIPLSDALIMGRDWYAKCPHCGYDILERRSASQTEILRARIERIFGLDRG